MAEGKLLGLAHIGVMVKNIDASMDFYMNTLGLELDRIEEMGSMKLVFLKVGTAILELVPTKETENRTAGPVDHICFEVEDIGPLMERLKAKGVAFERDTYGESGLFGGSRNVFLHGPDDERIEFFDFLKK